MNRVRIGVIGLGWFGQKHCEALAAIPEVEIHSLCTRTESRLAELGDTFQVANRYTDYNEMLADPKLDAVSIVTMWDQHLSPTLAALAAGKHVFLEKPMASTVADCEVIASAAEASDRQFMVGHICRFNPRYAAAQQSVHQGQIGKVLSMYARRNIPAFVTEEILNKIGPIIGDGVHDTDLMLWFSGAKIVTAYAQTVEYRGLKYPDLGWTMYRFDNGSVGVLENVWCLPKKTAFQIDERMEVIGSEGSIHVHETHPNFSICDSEGWHCPDTTYWPELHGQRAGALRDELAYFVRHVATGEAIDIITPRDSLEAVRACLAAEESAATGKVVEL